MKRTLSAALSLLLAASASAQVPASALTKIGTAAAVRGDVKAVSTGSAVGHVVSSGKPLFLNDHVTTDAAGRLQVMLVDETIFTLGPSSDMVLDEFVYDPKTNAGTVTANIAKGTFRFVTGKIAQRDPSRLKIKAAVGTIGVRGSIGVGETGPDGTTIINGGARNPDNYDDAAGIYAEGGGRTVNLTQPGVGTRIYPDGHLADASFMTGELNRIMGTLQNPAGKSDGNGSAYGRRSATDSSGRSTAVGGILAAESSDSADLTSALDSTLVNTVQGINGGAFSTWDSVRTIPSGTGSYVANGAYTCSGGTQCGAGSSGIWDFNVSVNFGTKLISGSIGATGPVAAGLSGSFSNYNYATASGQASFAPSIAGTGTFNGTTMTLIDRGGTIAKDMLVELHAVATSGDAVKGTTTGSR